MNITAEDHISLEYVVLVIAFSGLIIIWHGHSFVQRLMTFSWFLSALLKKKKKGKNKTTAFILLFPDSISEVVMVTR